MNALYFLAASCVLLASNANALNMTNTPSVVKIINDCGTVVSVSRQTYYGESSVPILNRVTNVENWSPDDNAAKFAFDEFVCDSQGTQLVSVETDPNGSPMYEIPSDNVVYLCTHDLALPTDTSYEDFTSLTSTIQNNCPSSVLIEVIFKTINSFEMYDRRCTEGTYIGSGESYQLGIAPSGELTYIGLYSNSDNEVISVTSEKDAHITAYGMHPSMFWNGDSSRDVGCDNVRLGNSYWYLVAFADDGITLC